MTQQRPLVEAMTAFREQQPISFHVPGHKQGILSGLPEGIRSALPYDVTELDGLDDLHYPEGAILEAQRLLADVYGAQQSFFLVNGSTVGNLAMIHAVCLPGDRVIVQRNSHKSIFHALELVNVRPVYIAPEWDEQSMTAVGVAAADLKDAILAHPEAKAVILTHPNYYGMTTAGLREIISFCHARKMPVLVDEAHGAHFRAGFPGIASALELGADVVVHSAHKTLPAMTMGSFLHVQGKLVDAKRIKKYLKMLQSSSPSYLIMASLDDARAFLHNYSQADGRSFESKRAKFVEALRGIRQLEVFEADDPLKLILRTPGWSGFQLKEQLAKQYIHVELADPHQVLLILPLLKQSQSYPFAEVRRRVKEAVRALADEPPEAIAVKLPIQQKISMPELSFEEADLGGGEWVSCNEAFGRISAGMVVPYPPGIPLIVTGERWTVAKLEDLMDYLATGAEIQGQHRLSEKLVYVLPEETRRDAE